MKHDRLPAVRDGSILTRKRFQFASAVVVGALLPWLLRGPGPGEMLDPPVLNTLNANVVAVMLAFWLRLSIQTYPGIRRSYVILPSALTGHAITLVWFVLTRFPYDRVGLALGFLLHVAWLYMLYAYAERRVRRRIAVVPVGAVDALEPIAEVDWLILSRPRLHDARGCDAIVADFSADLPDEWEAFLADAALDGRIVYQVKQLTESLTGRVELERLSENSFGSLLPARGYFYLKSGLDIAFAVLLLPFALLAMGAAALAILADDGRPVLFRQRRLGHAGRIFTAYKFRTMEAIDVAGDEEQIRAALATGETDPRVTKAGAMLRKYRIDELPQIINILKGQMSWIGPRPEPEVLSRWFVAEIPFYRYRHVVKPGISGWAQVNLGYVSGVEGINRKLQYDFYYIKYFSPWL
ncbi:MAG TPA: sugar transferase, partial [Sphingomicrobium sp.]|nr:sugar transferase [Sphingomicrobium sp.]